MQPGDDSTLLRQYAESNSDEAFAALVQRHLSLVYSVAMRCVADAHQAEEITQAVFIILARKAAQLRHHQALSSWLFQTTRLTANNFIRSEMRRCRREQGAHMQSIFDQGGDAPSPSGEHVWHQIAPLLDAAVERLREKDRRAIVLRFYEGRELREVGAALGATEAAAEKRVSRALDRLRHYFSRRGVSSTSAAIAGAISANSIQAPPLMLAKSVAAAAAAKGSITAVTTLTLAKATMKTMTWLKLKFALGVGAAAILAAGTATTLVAQHQSKIGLASSSSARTNATMPYRMMDDAYRLLGGVDQTKLVLNWSVSSKQKAVQTTGIHLTIQSTNQGPIPLRLNTNGQIIDFPHDEALRRENPPIVADQPKGSLNFTVWMQLPMDKGLTFPYHRLTDGVDELNRAVAEANRYSKEDEFGDFGGVFRSRVQGVVIYFPRARAGKARVEIVSKAGKKEYVAPANGQIKLMVDKTLQAEDPEVILSERPQGIVPDIHL